MTYICEQKLPEALSSLRTQEISSNGGISDSELKDLMPYMATCVGYKYPDGSLHSLLVADQHIAQPDNQNTRSADELLREMYALDGVNAFEKMFSWFRILVEGNQLKQKPTKIRNPQNEQEIIYITGYYLTYKNPNSRCFLPTANSICRCGNASTDFTYEVTLKTEDGRYSCYAYFPVETSGNGSLNLLDAIHDFDNMIDNDIDTFITAIPDARIDSDDDTCFFIPFTNEFGGWTFMEFYKKSKQDIRDMVVSIRIIELETRLS